MRTRSGTRTRNLTTLNRAPLPIGLLGLGASGRPRTGYLRVTNPVHDLLVLRWHRAGGRSRTGRLPITNRALPLGSLAGVVSSAGVEPALAASSGRRLCQLGYEDMGGGPG
jgi:hypothetical protein